MKTNKFNAAEPADDLQSPICRLDAKPLSLGKTTAAGTGAVSSAFLGFLV